MPTLIRNATTPALVVTHKGKVNAASSRPTKLPTSALSTTAIMRPLVLWGQTPKERGAETGVSPRTIYYRANLFDQAGMASLLPAEPPPPVPNADKRSLPPDIRQEIIDLYAQYPAFHPHEIATICFV